ncbi:hypothetical protein ACFXKD_21020 [Nocardiopsis aegyptia]|uniref:hypothetical protein n=1 Tax=Nocardiopsis aegyptia TaxID=220378 RepID=UPI00366BEC88
MTDQLFKPGELTTRKEVNQKYGAGIMQGIEPCDDYVFIYTDHSSGKEYGYQDGWLPERDEHGLIFEYTGAGSGDQEFHGQIGYRNRRIRYHVEDQRTLHVFAADGTVPKTNTKLQRYIGEFRIDEEDPFSYRLARNKDKKTRWVIVFRLRPVSDIEPLPKDIIKPLAEVEVLHAPSKRPKATAVKTENNKNKTASKSATPETTIRRREAELCEEFEAFLNDYEHEVHRFQIRAAELSSSLLTDPYDATDHVLYEAKGSSTREAIRMAIGQLMDYRRSIEPENPTLAVLLPSRPHDDLIDLLSSVNINIVYRHEDNFVGWPINANHIHTHEGSS